MFLPDMRLAGLRRAAVACCLSALAFAAPAEAGRFNNVIVLGDSWADDGVKSAHLKQNMEVWQINPAQLTYASRPEGRFSNGPVMSEQMAELYGIDPSLPENYAIGGAASGSNFGPFRFPFEMVNRPQRNWDDPDGQITFMLNRHGGVLDPDTLYYVAIGGNDFIEAPVLGWTANADTTKANILDGATRMANAGARHFMTINYYGPAGNIVATTVEEAWIDVKKQLGVDVIFVDTLSLAAYVEQNPEDFGMDPLLASTPCISGRNAASVNTCTPEEERQRLSWDGVHPTSRLHEIFALAGYALAESPTAQAAVADAGLLSVQSVQRSIASRLSSSGLKTKPVQLASAVQSDVPLYDLSEAGGVGELFFFADRNFLDRSATNLDPVVSGQASAQTLGIRFPGKRWTFGAAATLIQSEASLADGSSSDGDHIFVTGFGGWTPDMSFLPGIDVTLSAGKANVRTKRNPGIAGTLAAGSTSAREYAATIALGYDIPFDLVTLRPAASLQGARLELDGFTENGAPAGFNLIVRDQTAESLLGEIGVEAEASFSYGAIEFLPSAGIHWGHEFANRSRSVTVAPSTLPDLSFSARTGEGDESYGRIGAGLEARFEGGVSLGFGWSHSIGRDDWRTEGFSLGLSVPLG
ncbi:autotransporter domain-containing protein [Parvibaculum sp.]|uniref:autotransporter domain-containing protein n=2 Tax=Parvibaculum sp. TaxID=2024848 RepID=UPI001B0D9FE1|nr:autotransporter domain-containing protein [Parvibaculum sp.]MBO6634495.1 autotransporter domain-containing protein [Parvibaculum sp.]MBO6678245.1 autotransporter domain-containing protein [Parvibaculum sp.]